MKNQISGGTFAFNKRHEIKAPNQNDTRTLYPVQKRIFT